MEPWILAILAVVGGLVPGAALTWWLSRRPQRGAAPELPAMEARYATCVVRLRELEVERGRMPDGERREERLRLLGEAATLLRSLDGAPPARSPWAPSTVALVLVALVVVAGASSSASAPRPAEVQGIASPHGDIGADREDADLETLNQEAYMAILQGDLGTGMALMEQARRLAPDHPDVRVHLSMLRLSVGMVDRAREGLDEVLAERPDHVRASLWAGVVAAQTGDMATARSLWEKVAAADPSGMDGAQARGFLETRPAGEEP